jgi:hypothetical protein
MTDEVIKCLHTAAALLQGGPDAPTAETFWRMYRELGFDPDDIDPGACYCHGCLRKLRPGERCHCESDE